MEKETVSFEIHDFSFSPFMATFLKPHFEPGDGIFFLFAGADDYVIIHFIPHHPQVVILVHRTDATLEPGLPVYKYYASFSDRSVEYHSIGL